MLFVFVKIEIEFTDVLFGACHLGRQIKLSTISTMQNSIGEMSYNTWFSLFYSRYETNVIHPPLYAGTCQISSLHGNELIGGDFYANSRGLDHYKEFGYKAMMKSKDELDMDIQSDDWIKIRYKRNRGTLHDGDFPHFSSPIQFIAPGKKRVILGLNFFSASVGECCIRAPEHSDAFNRTVKLYQMMSKLGSEFGTAPGGKYSNSTPEELPDKEKENPTEKPEASKEPNSAKKGDFPSFLIDLSRIFSKRYCKKSCNGTNVYSCCQENERNKNT